MMLATSCELGMQTIATVGLLLLALLTGLVWSIAISLRSIARSLLPENKTES